jgi:hypothetical protein
VSVTGPGAAASGSLAELRDGLDRLVEILAGSAGLRDLLRPAEEARTEAAQDTPEPGRIRQLMAAVIRGAGNVTTVTAAAANVAQLAEQLARMIG